MKTLNEIKTHVICRMPLVGCLLKASEYKNISKEWQSINQKQEDFKRHLKLEEQISLLSSEEFGSTASIKEDEINEWLDSHGFSLKCPKLEPGDFATASFVKLFVEWLDEAEDRTMLGQNTKRYDCALFREERGKNINLNDKQWQMTSLNTKDSRTKVFIATTDNTDEFSNKDEEFLLNLAQTLQSEYCKPSPYYYKLICVPMLNLNLEISQDWICGINSSGWSVTKCIQQFILKLNEKGATAKSAAVMSSRGGSMITHPTLTFDKPFLLWFSRDGVTFPIFLSVCGYDCWEKPDNLD